MSTDLVRLSAHSASEATPVPTTQRQDGITPERQRRFIEALAATGSVADAARQAGVSRQAFYALRNRSGSRAFREAWDTAMGHALQLLGDTAFERAVDGVEEPVFWKGEQVGTRRRYNDRLLMFLLRARDPWSFAPLPDLRGYQQAMAPIQPPDFDALLDRLAPADGAPSTATPRLRASAAAPRHRDPDDPRF
jgi:hypothetical protein